MANELPPIGYMPSVSETPKYEYRKNSAGVGTPSKHDMTIADNVASRVTGMIMRQDNTRNGRTIPNNNNRIITNGQTKQQNLAAVQGQPRENRCMSSGPIGGKEINAQPRQVMQQHQQQSYQHFQQQQRPAYYNSPPSQVQGGQPPPTATPGAPTALQQQRPNYQQQVHNNPKSSAWSHHQQNAQKPPQARPYHGQEQQKQQHPRTSPPLAQVGAVAGPTTNQNLVHQEQVILQQQVQYRLMLQQQQQNQIQQQQQYQQQQNILLQQRARNMLQQQTQQTLEKNHQMHILQVLARNNAVARMQSLQVPGGVSATSGAAAAGDNNHAIKNEQPLSTTAPATATAPQKKTIHEQHQHPQIRTSLTPNAAAPPVNMLQHPQLPIKLTNYSNIPTATTAKAFDHQPSLSVITNKTLISQQKEKQKQKKKQKHYLMPQCATHLNDNNNITSPPPIVNKINWQEYPFKDFNKKPGILPATTPSNSNMKNDDKKILDGSIYKGKTSNLIAEREIRNVSTATAKTSEETERFLKEKLGIVEVVKTVETLPQLQPDSLRFEVVITKVEADSNYLPHDLAKLPVAFAFNIDTPSTSNKNGHGKTIKSNISRHNKNIKEQKLSKNKNNKRTTEAQADILTKRYYQSSVDEISLSGSLTKTKRKKKRKVVGTSSSSKKVSLGPPRLGPLLVIEGPAEGEIFPKGWTLKGFKRRGGATKGHIDTYWYSPTKKKFRSMGRVTEFLDVLKANPGFSEDDAWEAVGGPS